MLCGSFYFFIFYVVAYPEDGANPEHCAAAIEDDILSCPLCSISPNHLKLSI